ncbi:MAG TPA: aspartate 1-decarboxylase [Thermoanaerobaculia bacterium]
MRRLVRAAVRNATVTRAEGVTLKADPLILTAANILPLEEVEVVNHATGERVTTFAEAGASGEISAPGMRAGDVVSVLSWGVLHDGQTLNHTAKLVTLDASNRVVAVSDLQAGS